MSLYQDMFDAIDAKVNAGLFYAVSGVGKNRKVDDTKGVDPHQAILDETGKTFKVAEKYGRHLAQQVDTWDWQLQVEFNQRVSTEAFELAFCDKPITISAPADDLSGGFTLFLANAQYRHPPDADPTHGTKVTYFFTAQSRR